MHNVMATLLNRQFEDRWQWIPRNSSTNLVFSPFCFVPVHSISIFIIHHVNVPINMDSSYHSATSFSSMYFIFNSVKAPLALQVVFPPQKLISKIINLKLILGPGVAICKSWCVVKLGRRLFDSCQHSANPSNRFWTRRNPRNDGQC